MKPGDSAIQHEIEKVVTKPNPKSKKQSRDREEKKTRENDLVFLGELFDKSE